MKKPILAAFMLLFVFTSVIAQVTTSNIRGSVLDNEGVPLFGANVVAVHTTYRY